MPLVLCGEECNAMRVTSVLLIQILASLMYTIVSTLIVCLLIVIKWLLITGIRSTYTRKHYVTAQLLRNYTYIYIYIYIYIYRERERERCDVRERESGASM